MTASPPIGNNGAAAPIGKSDPLLSSAPNRDLRAGSKFKSILDTASKRISNRSRQPQRSNPNDAANDGPTRPDRRPAVGGRRQLTKPDRANDDTTSRSVADQAEPDTTAVTSSETSNDDAAATTTDLAQAGPDGENPPAEPNGSAAATDSTPVSGTELDLAADLADPGSGSQDPVGGTPGPALTPDPDGEAAAVPTPASTAQASLSNPTSSAKIEPQPHRSIPVDPDGLDGVESSASPTKLSPTAEPDSILAASPAPTDRSESAQSNGVGQPTDNTVESAGPDPNASLVGAGATPDGSTDQTSDTQAPQAPSPLAAPPSAESATANPEPANTPSRSEFRPAGVGGSASVDDPAAAAGIDAEPADQANPVWRQVRRALGSLRRSGPGEETMTIRLRPAELGSVTVRINTSAAGMRVALVADSPVAAQELNQQRHELLRDLDESGFGGTGVDVSTGQQWQQNNGDESPDNASPKNQMAAGDIGQPRSANPTDTDRSNPVYLMRQRLRHQSAQALDVSL